LPPGERLLVPGYKPNRVVSGPGWKAWLAPGANIEIALVLGACAEGRRLPGWRRRAGRGFVWVVPTLYCGRVVVRPYRRGGWMARLFTDLYFGVKPRSLAELEMLLYLEQARVPVVSGLGAGVQRVAGIGYRAWLVTRYWEGTETLWHFLRTTKRWSERAHVLDALGVALAQLYLAGVRHPDLHARNILVRRSTPEDPVRLIDFDRASMLCSRGRPRTVLKRLARSLRKLDPEGRYTRKEDWLLIETALWRTLREA